MTILFCKARAYFKSNKICEFAVRYRGGLLRDSLCMHWRNEKEVMIQDHSIATKTLNIDGFKKICSPMYIACASL